jgi:Glycosyl hydrolases family 32 C terminal
MLLNGSVLEVYANDRLALATRVYPVSEADVALQVWAVGSLHEGPRSALARPPVALTLKSDTDAELTVVVATLNQAVR